MNDWPSILATGGVMAALGFAFGLAYFALLRRGVSAFVAGAGSLHALALLIARLAAAVLFFVWATRFGAPGLVFALGGFVVARTLLLRAPE